MPAHLRILGGVLRALFIGIVLAVVLHVSQPQSESVWSVYETPGDLVRLLLGVALAVWIVFHLFMLPKDAGGYRTWVYLGLALVPLGLLCAVAVW